MAREHDSVYSIGSILDVVNKGSLGDGRSPLGLRHGMSEILLLIILGYLSGCTSLRSVGRFFNPIGNPDLQKARKNILLSFVELPHGIPSTTTVSRAIKTLNPIPLVTAFADFMYSLVPRNGDAPLHIAIDGKACLAALNKSTEGHNFYIVNVFAAAHHLFLYQTSVGPKSAEAKVIEQEIADILEGSPAVVTMDAMGTKKAILDIIFGKDSDAVLPIKKNNPNLMDECLVQISAAIKKNDDSIEHFVDLDQWNDTSPVRECIDNTLCEVFDEDNHPADDDMADPPRPISDFEFFQNVYHYNRFDSDVPYKFDKTSHMSLVKIGDYYIPMVYTHGRFERREYDLITDSELMTTIKSLPAFASWPQISNIGLVTRYRGFYVYDKKTKKRILKISVTRTPFLLTSPMTVEKFASTVRSHWAVEQAHYTIDEIFGEDDSTADAGNSAQNLSLLRKLVFNIVVVFRATIGRSSKSLDGFKEDMDLLAGKLSTLVSLLTKRIRSPFKEVAA